MKGEDRKMSSKKNGSSLVKRKRKLGAYDWFDYLNTILMILLCFVMIIPMWYVVCASFSDGVALMSLGGKILWRPIGFTLDAYKAAFKHPLIMGSFKNSVIITVLSVSVSMVMTILCAYVLSRQRVMLKKLFNLMVIITMFYSGTLISKYVVFALNLGLKDTYWALVLPGCLSVFNMIIVRTAFEGIPDSLNEAAYIDGASHWQVLWKVVVPLSKSTLAVTLLYYAVPVWNSWFSASIYIQSREKLPLQLVLREILIQNNIEQLGVDAVRIAESIQYAAMVIGTLPILLLYPALQKHFTKGVMIGAVKG